MRVIRNINLMKRAHFDALLVSTVVMILCNCSHRPLILPDTSPERRANIRGANAFSLSGGAKLVAIDGQTLLFENSADVAPGPHVARVCYDWPLSSYLKCEDFTFMAEAGHSYLVCGTTRGFMEPRIQLWIEDTRTGRAVAGTKP